MAPKVPLERAAEIIAELAAIELNPRTTRMNMSMGPYTAFLIISALQTAMAQPDMGPGQRESLRTMIEGIREGFESEALDLIDDGWARGGIMVDIEGMSVAHSGLYFVPRERPDAVQPSPN